MSAVQQSIDVSCPPGPSSKPAAAALLMWTHTGTDGHYIVAHTLLRGTVACRFYANLCKWRTLQDRGRGNEDGGDGIAT